MTDTPAAPDGAPKTTPGSDPGGKPGLFRRLRDAINPNEAAPDTAPVRPAAIFPGLGTLGSISVEDVSVPSADITAVPITISMPDLVDVFRDSGLTRLPVFDGTLDSPVGFVHLKDFALRHGFDGKDAFEMADLVRDLLYVPPSMTIAVLLAKMQTERTHIALVIDEYGGTDGLVTIEDLIEEVIGEIEDEHDIAEGEFWTRETAGVWLAKAKTPLDDFEKEIGTTLTDHAEIDEEEVDTLGGLVFMLAGHVPARGEVIPHPEGPEFEVVEADPRRIKRLRVRLEGSDG